MQEALVIQVNYVSTINTHRRFSKDDVMISGFTSSCPVFALNLQLLYLPLFSLLCRSQETPLQHIEPQR